MQFLRKRWRITLIALIITLPFIFPNTAYASTVSLLSEDPTVVVSREEGNSSAVVYKRHNSYFFGHTKGDEFVNQGRVAPRELIVKLKSSSAPSQTRIPILSQIIRAYESRVSEFHSELGMTKVQLTDDQDYFKAIQALQNDPRVEYVEPNYIATTQQVPNDPHYNQTWGPKAIGAEEAWAKVSQAQRAGVTIAILDTGINAGHEDLSANIVPGYNFVNNNTNTHDAQGHGTHVAGIAAAITHNGKGIAGMSGGSKIMPVKVLGDDGSGSYSAIISGIKYAVDRGAHVINLSLGGPGTSAAMQEAVDYAISRGVHVVGASGNSNSAVVMPGNLKGVITVGAIDSSGARASYSNYGPTLDLMAPGSQILSTYIGGSSRYSTMSGTSMATPYVSGVVALLKAANPSITPTAVESILRQTAKDMGAAGFDDLTGYGLVNAGKAVEMAIQSRTVPTPPSTPTPTPVPQPSPQPTPSPSPAVNLAQGKNAVASSVEGSSRTAAMAFDGNPSTRWASRPYLDPQWIYVDLSRAYTITRIVLKWDQYYAKAYDVQVSDDARTWRTVYRTASSSGGTVTLNGSVTGRYVRIYGTQRAFPYGYSLSEVEVYGQ